MLAALLAGCFFVCASVQAQEPDEELYYPFQNAYDEEYRPMIEVDSTLFYRALQQTGDRYGQTTDYKFSFVAYARRGEPYRADNLILNGVRLSTRYASALRVLASSSRNASVQVSGRGYLAGVRFATAAELGRGWEMAATVQGRTGRDLYVDGVFSNALTVGIKAVKRFGPGVLSLIVVVPPVERSLRAASTEEAFSLTGNRLYNPAWGYQNGEMRSARIRREVVPLAAVTYEVDLGRTEQTGAGGRPRTSLAVTAAAEAGVRKYSSLAWFNARSPLPDGYREMPSYLQDQAAQLALEEVWRSRDPRYVQIDWDGLYKRNRMATGGTAFAVADRVDRVTNLHLSVEGVTHFDERLTVRYTVRGKWLGGRHYRQMRDLLGGDPVVDHDYFLIDDDTYSSQYQNNLRAPDRVIGEGDRFGYDYEFRRQEIGAGATLEYMAGGRWRLLFGVEAGEQAVFRRGHYEKEIFAGERSYGKSRTLHFTSYALRASAGYTFSARQSLVLSLEASSEAPRPEQLFLNPEYNNRPVDQPVTEKSYQAELDWVWVGRVVDLRASLFAVRTADGLLVRRYFDDASGNFSDMVASGIGTGRYGAEASASIQLARRWTLSLAASAGRYVYAENPRVSVYADTDNTLIDRNAESYMGDCYVGGAPQLTGFAGLNFYGRKGWGFRLEGAWAADRYIDPTPLRRTPRIGGALAESPEAFEIITRQERLADAFTLDVTLFKTFYFEASRLTFMFSVRNLLGLDNQVFSGYESMRLPRVRVGDDSVYRPMASQYTYGYPRTFYIGAYFSF